MTEQLVQLQHFEHRSLPTTRELAAIAFRQKGVFAAFFLGVIVLLSCLGIWNRKFEAHLKILVLRQRVDALVSAQPNAPSSTPPAVTEEDLNSEVELLHSNDLLRRVVLATGLQQSGKFLKQTNNPDVNIAVAVQKLDRELKVEPVRKTNVIAVSYRSGDPRMAARVLETVAAAYLEKHQQVHHPSGQFQFFDQQADEIQREVERSQARLAAFERANGVASPRMERDLNLQRLTEFDADARQARVAQAATLKRIKSLKDQLGVMQPRLATTIKTAENLQLMQQLKSTLMNLLLKRTELLTKFDPSYRPVQEIDQQIAETRAAITAEESKPPQETTTDQDSNYQMLRGELGKAKEELSGLNARIVGSTTVAGQYRAAASTLEQKGLAQDDLEREKKAQENNLLLYLQKREEARINDALDRQGILNVAIAEKPLVPALPIQSPLRILELILLAGFLVGTGAGLIADFASPRFRTPGEVVAYLKIPVLLSLPGTEA